MGELVQVYVVDPDPAFARRVVQLTSRVGPSVQAFDSPANFLATFAPQGPAVLVLECLLPGMHGIEVWKQVLAAGWPGVTVVFLTSEADVPLAVEAMKLGASDVLLKPCGGSQLTAAVQPAMREAESAFQLRRESRAGAVLMAQLSPRQRQVTQLLVAGLSLKATARQTALSEKTIEYHRTKIFKKFGVTNVVHLIRQLSGTDWAESASEPGDAEPGAP